MLMDSPNKCLNKIPDFIYDEACLDIINTLNQTIYIFGQYTECHKCNFQKLSQIDPAQNSSVLVNTVYPIDLYYVRDANTTEECRFQKTLSEHYRYG
ncbi:hypothetical protein HHI36_018694 [Cryptolaemus montrouzieri]|uniref:Uncharacterized protein n=1 Tax=Cryptolaemus montrouzieri TaxID=559131 RepID=A0ABD2P0P5_9CUCU